MLLTKCYKSFDSLPASHFNLFEEASAHSIFLSLPWFKTLQQIVFTDQDCVRIITAEDSQSARPRGALVVWIEQTGKGAKPFVVREITSLTNFYSCYYAPIIRPGDQDIAQVVDALLEQLFLSASSWDVLNLQMLDLSTATSAAFLQSLAKRRVRTQTYFCNGNWHLNVGHRSYAEYFGGLSSRIRKNVPYYRRRLEKQSNLEIVVYKTTADADRAFREFEFVYNCSWRKPEAYPDFMRNLVKVAAEQGWLRMAVAYVSSEAAAAQLWFVHGGIAYIYKICYQEKFSSSSVGSVLTAHMIERVIDTDHVHTVDYLTGDDSYKSDWMSARRELSGLIVFNKQTLRGRIASIRHIEGMKLKKFVVHYCDKLKRRDSTKVNASARKDSDS